MRTKLDAALDALKARCTLEQQNTIWINVANGVGEHGSFLRRFGAAFQSADYRNKRLLESCSLHLIGAYILDGPEYLKEGGV